MPLTRHPVRPARWMALALLLAIGIGVLFASAIWTLRNEQWRFAERSSASLAAALTDSVSVTLGRFDRSLEALAMSLENPGARVLPGAPLSRVPVDESLRMGGNGGVMVLNAQGNTVIDYGGLEPHPANLADRDYFQAFSQGQHTGLYVGAPIRGLTGADDSLHLSRAVRNADGSFAGVVVGVIRLNLFHELVARLSAGGDRVIRLMRSDGTSIARFPLSAQGAGRPAPISPHVQAFANNTSQASAGSAVIEEVESQYSLQRVDGFPLLLEVSESVDQIRSHGLLSAQLTAGLAVALMLACIGLGAWYARDIQKRAATSTPPTPAERDIRSVVENAPAVMAYWDADLRNCAANDAFLHYFGLRAAQLHGMPMPEILGTALQAQCLAQVTQALAGKPQWHECQLRDASGALHHVMVSWTPDVQATAVRGLFMQLIEITERAQLEDQLYEDQERMRLTLESVEDGVICTDATGRVTAMNPAAERVTGWQARAAWNRDAEDLFTSLAPDDGTRGACAPPSALVMSLRDALQQQASAGLMRRAVVQRADGTRFDLEATSRAIANSSGQIAGAVMVLRDVTERLAMALRMTHMAQCDPLTDLPNRPLLQDRAAVALAQAQRDGKSVAVVYLDLDRFQKINHGMNHDAGDLLLVLFARRLQLITRATDTVARNGGDEFIVLLTGVADMEQLVPLARKLLSVCVQPFSLQAEQVSIGMSGGMAVYPQHGTDFDTLVRRADGAMHEAKQAGRGRLHLYVHEAPSECLTGADAAVDGAVDAFLTHSAHHKS